MHRSIGRPCKAGAWLLAACLAGCGGGFVFGSIDCDDEISAVTGRWGTPDRVDDRIEAGLHIHTFWYWRSGFGFTFVWGGGLPCERRDFTFAPVG